MSEDRSHFRSDVAIEVFTTPARPMKSALPPLAPDDEPTWSPMSSTLIYGEEDAILVDALMTFEQVDALADWVEAKGCRPSRVYITHGHGDHWIGLKRLSERFPGIVGLATSEVVAHAQFETTDPRTAGYFTALFPGEVPDADARILPQLLTGDTLDLEGSELRVLRVGQADTAESTVLHVPSLSAVVTGDLAYNEVHMMTAETGDSERDRWISNLDTVAALDPAIVVAGHKKVDNDDNPKIIAESQQYLRDFTRIASVETSAVGIATQMIGLYPTWQNHRTLWYSASAAIKRKAG